jgi:hypothetical protein
MAMAGRSDWYSSADWDPEAEAEFEAKLRRARNKAEYLRAKGAVLIRQKDERLREAGRGLLLRLVNDFPDALTVAWAHELLGDAYEEDASYDQAERQYRDALSANERISGVPGHAPLKLANLIAATHQRDKYEEVEALLDAYKPVWKLGHFWVELARARLAADLGDRSRAAAHARAALALEADEEPPVHRHPGVGLLRTDSETVAELEALSRG